MDDAGFSPSICSRSSRTPLGDLRWRSFVPSLRSPFSKNPNPSSEYGDRFIPMRSSMDFDFARCLLTGSWKQKENAAANKSYQKILAETFSMNRRILSFKRRPPETAGGALQEVFYDGVVSHRTRSARLIPQSPVRTLFAPELADNYFLNLMDWGSSNVLAVALGNMVYLWDANKKRASELMHVDENRGPITSVNWAPDGQHVAIGLNSSDVQLWDSSCGRLMRTLRGMHRFRVGSLAWNKSILTTGGMDGKIVNNDVRIRSHIVNTFKGHQIEVCGLKWSDSGRQLASGGNDNLVFIWDLPTASSNPPPRGNQWLYRFQDHIDTVRALAWCPFQSNLLASGGGDDDQCIKFWNTRTGACLGSVDTGSKVCSLLWNKHERELLSSHGFTQNQLTLWKYPSMVKIAELTGHTSQVLFMAQSPDGCTVASAAADETVRFWNAFGTAEEQKPTAKTANAGPFVNFNYIR